MGSLSFSPNPLIFAPRAEVAELVDAHDSKSCALGRVGSIPTFGTSYAMFRDQR